MIKIHHLENSRSHRIIWLLESLKLDYEIIFYKRDVKTSLAPPELLKVSPLGKSPVLEVDGMILMESGAIMEYLLSKYDNQNIFHPKNEDPTFKDYLFWLHYAEGSLMSPLLMKLLFTKTIEKVPFFIRPFAKIIFKGIDEAYLGKTLNNSFHFIEEHLSKKTFFIGEKLSVADMMMSFPLEASVAGRIDTTRYKNICRFVKMIKKDLNYQNALKKGGDYVY